MVYMQLLLLRCSHTSDKSLGYTEMCITGNGNDPPVHSILESFDKNMDSTNSGLICLTIIFHQIAILVKGYIVAILTTVAIITYFSKY